MRKLSDNDLCYCSATNLIQKFKNGLSPVTVLEAVRARCLEIKSQTPNVNAFTFEHWDEAMEAARVSAQRYRDGTARPLEGIPTALKDEHDKIGWVTTSGSNLINTTAGRNHPVTEKLIQAGAVLHAQTTVPELYLLPVTWSKRWGVTRSAWDKNLAAGGSSGGSAAALAAGMTTLATGSDMGGSIRIPAALNGLYGYKAPGDPASSMPQASNGPLARTFNDLVLMQNVLADDSPSLPKTYDPIAGLKIAYSMDQGWAEVAAEVRSNTEEALRRLKGCGAIVEEVQLGFNYDELYQALLSALLGGDFGRQLELLVAMANSRGVVNLATSYVRDMAVKAARVRGHPEQVQEALAVAARADSVLKSRVFDNGYSALIMPTVLTTQVPPDLDPAKDRVAIKKTRFDDSQTWVPASLGWALTPLLNLCYHYPVLAVPTGLDGYRPTSMQIVSRPGDALTAFRVGAAYSAVAPSLFAGRAYPGNEPETLTMNQALHEIMDGGNPLFLKPEKTQPW